MDRAHSHADSRSHHRPAPSRRDVLLAGLSGALGASALPALPVLLGAGAARADERQATPPAAAPAEPPPRARLGIPGPFPGRVAEVRHAGSIKDRTPVREAVAEMVDRGMMGLTGAPDAVAAWRTLFEPGDVVGIKVNPVGHPHAPTNHELVHEVVAGLKKADVAPRDIVVFDRYRAQFIKAGYVKNLPEGVRWDASCEDYDDSQLDIAGYDPDVFRELDLVSRPHHDPHDPRTRRSHLSLIVSRGVSKIINLPVLKDHGSAGVTLALKNMSHGFVNNVARSHASPTTNACNTFIPAIVSLPQIRTKAVLHILDGLRGIFEGGPSGRLNTVWYPRALYFATDPVAMDRIGWEIIDAKRRSLDLPPVAEARFIPPRSDDERRRHSFRQPEHIELAAALGLGVFDREQIDFRQADLTGG
jgi:uncharacterized protein (DUF362 family)